MRRKPEPAPWLRRIQIYLPAVLKGLAVLFGVLLLFAAGMTVLDAPPAAVSVMSGGALCVSAFCAGFSAAGKNRHHGLITGLLTGMFSYGAVYLFGTLLFLEITGWSAVGKLFRALLFGAAGGVVGVNRHFRKPS